MKCKNCGQDIYQTDFRWRHTNGMYSCAPPPPGTVQLDEWMQMPRGTRPRAEA